MNTTVIEPFVTLRYFGPVVNPDASATGAYRKNEIWYRDLRWQSTSHGVDTILGAPHVEAA